MDEAIKDKRAAALAKARAVLAEKRKAGLIKAKKPAARKPAAKKAAAKGGKLSAQERKAKLAANLAKARKVLAQKRKQGLIPTRKAVVKAVAAKGNSLRALLEKEAAALEARAKAIWEAAKLL